MPLCSREISRNPSKPSASNADPIRHVPLVSCDLNLWVNAAIQRRVETVELALPPAVKLPRGIITSATIVVLKLTGVAVHGDISAISLPLLKVLHLNRVQFFKRQYLEMLLSHCHVLEDLQIGYLRPWSGWNSDEPLCVTEFESFPKLVTASVSCSWFPITKFHNAKFLRIHLKYFNHAAVTFHNLIRMELSVLTSYWHLLVLLLNDCPMLQILDIKNENAYLSQDQPYPEYAPECILSRLRECTFRHFYGIDAHLRFARYVLQNARVLRRLTIYSTSCADAESRLQMLKALSKVPRSSTTCELLFE